MLTELQPNPLHTGTLHAGFFSGLPEPEAISFDPE